MKTYATHFYSFNLTNSEALTSTYTIYYSTLA